jgi:hypothetical protein
LVNQACARLSGIADLVSSSTVNGSCSMMMKATTAWLLIMAGAAGPVRGNLRARIANSLAVASGLPPLINPALPVRVDDASAIPSFVMAQIVKIVNSGRSAVGRSILESGEILVGVHRSRVAASKIAKIAPTIIGCFPKDSARGFLLAGEVHTSVLLGTMMRPASATQSAPGATISAQ